VYDDVVVVLIAVARVLALTLNRSRPGLAPFPLSILAVSTAPDSAEAWSSAMDEQLAVQVTIEEIEKDVSAYLERVKVGETLVIVKAGKPLAEIKPILAPSTSLRPFGLCEGEFTVPEDFDVPLPDDVVRAFEGR
jgi:antitoxin (DNA-binding transcriptional repressor) of toxin-antitoxin stability system